MFGVEVGLTPIEVLANHDFFHVFCARRSEGHRSAARPKIDPYDDFKAGSALSNA